jgi:hypothetical protein
VLADTDLIHMIRKERFAADGADAMSVADQFSKLAGIACQVSALQRRSGEIPPFDQQRDKSCRFVLDLALQLTRPAAAVR